MQERQVERLNIYLDATATDVRGRDVGAPLRPGAHSEGEVVPEVGSYLFLYRSHLRQFSSAQRISHRPSRSECDPTALRRRKIGTTETLSF